MRNLAIFPYISLVKMKLINALAYRASSWSAIFAGAFYGFIQTSIILAFYTYGNSENIIVSQQQAVSHMWLVVIFHGLMPYRVNAEIYQKISSGRVAFDLCRPLDLYWHWYSVSLSDSLTKFAIQSPLIILMVLLLPSPYALGPPVSSAAFFVFVFSIIIATLLSCTMIILISLSFMNADVGTGIAYLAPSVVILFSGDLFPLPILPKAIVTVIRLLPFAGLKDIPISIYLGLIPLSEAINYIGIQLIWTLILIVLGRKLLKSFTKYIIIQGG